MNGDLFWSVLSAPLSHCSEGSPIVRKFVAYADDDSQCLVHVQRFTGSIGTRGLNSITVGQNVTDTARLCHISSGNTIGSNAMTIIT